MRSLHRPSFWPSDRTRTNTVSSKYGGLSLSPVTRMAKEEDCILSSIPQLEMLSKCRMRLRAIQSLPIAHMEHLGKDGSSGERMTKMGELYQQHHCLCKRAESEESGL